MNSIALRVEHRQQQTLSPQLQRAVRLLQLSSLDFAQELRDVLGRNPFLEGEELEPELAPTLANPDGSDRAPIDEMPGMPREGDVRVDDTAADGSERDGWQADGSGSPNRRSDDGELTWMDRVAAEDSLRSHLHQQLNVMPLPLRDLALAKVIVESLDDDGYLRASLAELLPLTEDLEPPASLDELTIAMKRVQALEPAGVGARTVGECLLLQLPAITCPQERGLAGEIVLHHLEALAARDVNGLARRLGCTASQVEAVCDRIRRLDPRPGWRFGGADIQYVTPDVLVKKVRGQWAVNLNPTIAPRIRLNHVYAEMFQRSKAAESRQQVQAQAQAQGADAAASGTSELAAHLQEARWTVRNIEQRFATILSVAQEIVRRQKQFFEYGPLAMKPLALRDVADKVGLHESTVSRVTNNKYMATPLGVFELKYFFSRAMTTASGGAFSGTAIRGLIKDMIEAERPESPLSDAEIARQLARQGLTVARRTVTKYRQLMKIEAVERRRRHPG